MAGQGRNCHSRCRSTSTPYRSRQLAFSDSSCSSSAPSSLCEPSAHSQHSLAWDFVCCSQSTASVFLSIMAKWSSDPNLSVSTPRMVYRPTFLSNHVVAGAKLRTPKNALPRTSFTVEVAQRTPSAFKILARRERPSLLHTTTG